jgi:hypothetical protein
VFPFHRAGASFYIKNDAIKPLIPNIASGEKAITAANSRQIASVFIIVAPNG